jgi:hypothetical protein
MIKKIFKDLNSDCVISSNYFVMQEFGQPAPHPALLEDGFILLM